MKKNEKTTSQYYCDLLSDVRRWLDQRPTIESAVLLRSDQTHPELFDRRAEWTNALLNALADIGRDRNFYIEPTRLYFSRDARGQGHNSKYDKPRWQGDDTSEFMTDLTWWYSCQDLPWWDLPLGAALQLDLVVESEWGWMEGRNYDHHIEVVAADFCKLLFSRADHRLLLTSCSNADKERFLNSLQRLRARSGLSPHEVCVWLWDDKATWSHMIEPTVVYP